MEKLSDILSNIKERFTNPLVFSFICSWIIFNWKITIALIWYDQTQIEAENYKSIYGFIDANLSTSNSFGYPFLIAAIYTFGFPIIKNLTRAFYTWSSKWGDNWHLKIIDGGKISVNKYIKLKEDHEKRSKILEKVISDESSYLENLNAVKTELLETKNSLLDLQSKLNATNEIIGGFYDISVLNGKWINYYQISPTQKGSETIEIENGNYYTITSFGEKKLVFEIKDFHYDKRNKKISFLKVVPRDQKSQRPASEHFNWNKLEFITSDHLSGTENELTLIEYKRN